MFRTLACLSLAAVVLTGRPLRADKTANTRSASAAELDRKGAEKLGWKLALQAWSANFQMPKESTVFHSIDIAKALGLRYIELYPGQPISADDKAGFGPGMSDAQIEAVLGKAKSAGVKIINCGVIGIPNNEKAADKFFAWAKKVGISIIVSEPDPKALPMINKVAGAHGIRVAIHDHPKPSRYWDPEYVYSLTKDLKNVGFCADVGHWKRSGLEPVEVLKKYGHKIFSLHFKDLVPDKSGKHWHDVVWGTGDSHMADMMRVLKEKGFKGPFSVEYEYSWDMPTLKKCVRFFFNQANKLAAG